MKKNDIKIIRPPIEIVKKLNRYITDNNLTQFQTEINYHFNIGEWNVNLADTKRSMINYDFSDLVNNFQAKVIRKKDETNREYQDRQKEATEILRVNLIKLYKEFREYVIEQLTSMVKQMDYNDLFRLFQDTWGNAPFKLNYLLEDMFLLLGDKSMMQNVVGPSGAFKSTRSMIEFNSLPSVLLIDDATIAGISRDSQTKGNEYLNDTVVYYNDVGDSVQMQSNFKDCLQSVYKKLFSEGMINRTLSQKNSDRTLRLDLRTPKGFKLKFNSVKPVFTEDEGQTASRMMVINLPSYTAEEAEELVRSGRFGEDVWSEKDPRIFKDVFQVYYQTREKPGFTSDYEAELAHRCNVDNSGEPNFHGIKNIIYVHTEMAKLYGIKLYKEKYYNRVMLNTSIPDLELELYNVIHEGLGVSLERFSPYDPYDLHGRTIAKTKSAAANKNRRNYDSFTVKAVKGIRRDFIRKNSTKISSLLNAMTEHDLCAKVGQLNDGYNVYVLLVQEDQNV